MMENLLTLKISYPVSKILNQGIKSFAHTFIFTIKLIFGLIMAPFYFFVMFHAWNYVTQQFWMAKANDYQTFPMDRLKKANPDQYFLKYWDSMDFSKPVAKYEHVYNKYFICEKVENVHVSESYFSVKNLLESAADEISEMLYMSWFIPITLDNAKKLSQRNNDPWFYFEVEICDLDSDFAIGFVEFPKQHMSDTELEEKLQGFYKNPRNKGFFDIPPGQYDNSFGFYLRSGDVVISRSVEFSFPIDKIFQAMNHPKRLFEINDDNNPFDDDNESEEYNFIGDCVGIAYNCVTGQIFITINGTLLNAPHPKVTTEINLQLFLQKLEDKELEDFDYEEEMNQLNKNPNEYLKKIEMEPQYQKGMRDFPEFKVPPGLKYMPVIYCGPQTRFNVNIGSSAFRNGQPEFKNGLLVPYHNEWHKYLTDPYDNYWQSDFLMGGITGFPMGIPEEENSQEDDPF